MKRAVLLLLLAGCQTPEVRPVPARLDKKEKSLRAFAEKAGAIKQFRAFYELEDTSTNKGVLLELTYQAPSRAKLVYPGRFEVFLENGTVTAFLDSPPETWYRIEYRAEFERIRSEFAPALQAVDRMCAPARLDIPGKILFDIGAWENLRNIQTLYTALRYSLSPGLFGWLLHLRDPAYQMAGERIFQRDGDGRSTASVEVELLENGFLKSVRILPPRLIEKNTHPGITLTLKQVTYNPVPEEAFRIPGRGNRTDLTESISGQLRATIANEIEKSMFRHLVQKYRAPLSSGDKTNFTRFFTLLYRLDLQSIHDLRGMVDRVREGQEKMVRFARKELGNHQDRERILEWYRKEMENQLETNLEQIRIFEAHIGKEYRRLLRRTLREVFAPEPLQMELEEISRKGLHTTLKKNLHDPVRKIHEEQAAILQGEADR